MRKQIFVTLFGCVFILFGGFDVGMLNLVLGTLVSMKVMAYDSVPGQKDMIEIFDSYGRKMLVSREEWRKNVLPGNIKRNWNNPDELYQNIVLALHDGFYPDILKASARLLIIDKNKERNYIVRSIVLMENGRNREAKAVLQSYIDKYTETGYVLTNLAKVYANEGNNAKAEELLWRGLQLDPNQDNGVEWWIAIYNEKGGKAAYVDELKKISNIKGSWRAQLWLAREALEQKDLSTALQYYKHVISLAKDVPDVLTQISGDLGKNGFYGEVFNLILPIYDLNKHDVFAGLNILQAYLENRRYEEGVKLLQKMFALNRPDIRDRLMDLSVQFDSKLRNLPRAIDDSKKILAGVVTLDKPIFFYGLNGASWFLPKIKRSGAKIGLMPLAAISSPKVNVIQHETDAGRLTRSMPLYIAERLFFETNSYSQVFITVTTKDGGLVTSGIELGVDYFLETISKSKNKLEFDYYISGALTEADGVWEIILTIWDCKSQQKIKSLTRKTSSDLMGQDVKGLVNELLEFLNEQGSLTIINPVDYYKPVADNLVGHQLLSYGQALVQVLAVNDHGTKDTVLGERAIIRNSLDLALWASDAIIPKILFISSLAKSYAYHSDIYREFKEYAIKLVNDNREDENIPKFFPLIYKIYGMDREFDEFEKGLDDYPEDYRDWFVKLKEIRI